MNQLFWSYKKLQCVAITRIFSYGSSFWMRLRIFSTTLVRKSSLRFNLFLRKFSCFLILCLSFRMHISLSRCSFGFQWRPLLKKLPRYLRFCTYPWGLFRGLDCFVLSTGPSHMRSYVGITLISNVDFQGNQARLTSKTNKKKTFYCHSLHLHPSFVLCRYHCRLRPFAIKSQRT